MVLNIELILKEPCRKCTHDNSCPAEGRTDLWPQEKAGRGAKLDQGGNPRGGAGQGRPGRGRARPRDRPCARATLRNWGLIPARAVSLHQTGRYLMVRFSRTPGKRCNSSRSSSKVMVPLQSLSADSKSASVSWSSFSLGSEMALSYRHDCSTVRSSSASMEPLPVSGEDEAYWGPAPNPSRLTLYLQTAPCLAQPLYRGVNFRFVQVSANLMSLGVKRRQSKDICHLQLTNLPWLPTAGLNRGNTFPSTESLWPQCMPSSRIRSLLSKYHSTSKTICPEDTLAYLIYKELCGQSPSYSEANYI